MAVTYAPFGGRRTAMNDYEQQDAATTALNAQLQQQSLNNEAQLFGQRGMADVKQNYALQELDKRFGNDMATMDKKLANDQTYRAGGLDFINFNELGGRQAVQDANTLSIDKSNTALRMLPAQMEFDLNSMGYETNKQNLELDAAELKNKLASEQAAEGALSKKQKFVSMLDEAENLANDLTTRGRIAEAQLVRAAKRNAINNGTIDELMPMFDQYAPMLTAIDTKTDPTSQPIRSRAEAGQAVGILDEANMLGDVQLNYALGDMQPVNAAIAELQEDQKTRMGTDLNRMAVLDQLKIIPPAQVGLLKLAIIQKMKDSGRGEEAYVNDEINEQRAIANDKSQTNMVRQVAGIKMKALQEGDTNNEWMGDYEERLEEYLQKEADSIIKTRFKVGM